MDERICPKCNLKIEGENKFCPVCGTELKLVEPDVEIESSPQTSDNTFWSGWNITAVISILCACFTFYKGYDKMAHYYSSDYASLAKNAYVGGDAYNYIINGTYATSYFVLTTMFVLAAIGLFIVHYVSKIAKSREIMK